MKISVVIVTYNSIALIDRCLAPLVCESSSDLEIVVWDNNSPDGTFEYVKEKYPQIKLFGGNGNLGFAKANNAAFGHCTGDYILLLNPDAFLASVCQVRELAAFAGTQSGIGAVGPMLINPGGDHQVGDAGWNVNLMSAMGHFLFFHRIVARFRSIYITNPALFSEKAVAVDWVCGACMLVRTSVVRSVGGLDERIFMYGEDVEWGSRIRHSGFRILYIPSVKILHLQGGTQKRGEAETFSSVKWIDALLVEVSSRSSYLEFSAFKLVLFVGFVLRMFAYFFSSAIRRDSNLLRCVTMRDYASYVIRQKFTPS